MSDIIDRYTIDGTVFGLGQYNFDIKIEADTDAHPGDYDCYTDKQVAAWKNDSWRFVVVKVTPTRHDVTVHGASEYLAGVEYGDYVLTDENDNVTGRKYFDRQELQEYPIREMAEQAALRATALIAAL